MKTCLLNFFSILSIWLLATPNQLNAQTPHRVNNPRKAAIGGRVTIAGKPAVNVIINLAKIELQPGAADASYAPILYQTQTMTDGDGRYLFRSLARGSYVVRVILNACVIADDPRPRRTVILDDGAARQKIDFALIRGGVITGRLMDDEGTPLIQRPVQLYSLDKQGQESEDRFDYDQRFITDDRGVYRIYGLPPGRYIISAGGDDGSSPISSGWGKFARTYHPQTTDEKLARIIEIKEGDEIREIDIRFGTASKTRNVSGQVVDKETGNPIPRIPVFYLAKFEKNAPDPKTVITDVQGRFKLTQLPPGRYQIIVSTGQTDDVGVGYTSEATEFEITNDDVSGVEVKAFPCASVNGVVVIDGAGTAAIAQFPLLSVYSYVTPLSDSPIFSVLKIEKSGRVDFDGSFVINGLPTGRVRFELLGHNLRIKRIEREGVEVKDPIEVKAGEKISGLRIFAYEPHGRIRGKVQITGGTLPDGSRLKVKAARLVSIDESTSGILSPSSFEATGSAFIDRNGRFAIEGLPAGNYDLTTSVEWGDDPGLQLVNPPESKQLVTIEENEETRVTITISSTRINRHRQQKDRQ